MLYTFLVCVATECLALLAVVLVKSSVNRQVDAGVTRDFYNAKLSRKIERNRRKQ